MQLKGLGDNQKQMGRQKINMVKIVIEIHVVNILKRDIHYFD